MIVRSSSKRRTYLAVAAATALVASYSHQVQGQTFNVSWVGPLSSTYGTASNWSTNAVPNNNVALGDFFNVTINRVGGAVVTLNADPTILNLTIGANAANQLTMGDTRTLTLIGANGGGAITVSNAGTINIGSTPAATAALFLNGTSANISGGGQINLLGNSVLAGTGTVTSNNTIIGAGSLGQDGFAFINNGTVTANGGTLTLDPRASGGFVNNALVQALAGGTTVFSGTGGGVFNNTNGVISVAAAGGRINLMNGATIVGGTIQTAGLNTSIFFVPGTHSATLNGVTSSADVNVGLGSTLSLVGTITNNSRIRTNSSPGVATYAIGSSTVTLTGTGSLVLSQFVGALGNLVGTGTLVNGATHTIAGAGTIGGNSSLFLDNQGTISANLAGQTLVVDSGLSSANNGTFEARNGGTLRVVGGFFSSTNGDYVAADASSIVELTDAVQIASGQFAGPGIVRVPTGQTAFSIGSDNSGNLEAQNGATLAFSGFTVNTGTISALSTGSVTTILLNAPADTGTLMGNGGVVLSGSGARIVGFGTLNNIDNTIRGEGAIGQNAIALANAGTIIADAGVGKTLTIDPSPAGMVNTGVLRAVAGSILQLSGNGGGEINNTAGRLEALDGVVALRDGVVVHGGTLSSSGIGNVQIGATHHATVTNATITAGARLLINGNGSLTLGGTFQNDGTIGHLGAAVDPTTIEIPTGTTTLNGSGLLQLGVTNGEETSVIGAGTLVNASGHTIAGAGSLGSNTLSLRNSGTINANDDFKRLRVDPGVGAWTNSGTMLASNNATLELNGTGGGGQLGNTGGRIIAQNASNVTLNGVLINGGSLITNGSGTISLAPSSTSTISFMANTGHVVVERLRTLKIDGTVTNSGTISITPTSSQATVEVLAGSTLTNSGTILMKNIDGISSSPQLFGSGVLNNSGLIRGDGGIDLSLGGSTFTINNTGVIESDSIALNLGSLQNPPPLLLINNTGALRMRPSTSTNTIGANVELFGPGAFEVQANSTLLSFGKINTPALLLDGAMAQSGNPASFGNLQGTGSLLVGFTLFNTPIPGIVTVNHARGLSGVVLQVGTMTTTAGGGTLGTSFIEGTLTIGGLGPARWNLNDHDLVLDYAGPSALPAVQNHIAAGRNGGSWNGTGLTSDVAKNNPSHNTTLGAIEASDFIAAAGTTTFSGQSIDATSVLVKYTYYGDTDLNGVVNFDDYSRIDAGFNNNRTGWFNGDFDYSGQVNFDDYAVIDLAFNTQASALARAMSYLDGGDRSDRGMDGPALQLVQDHFAQFGNAYATSFLNAVPEPGCIGGFVAAAASLLRRQRRRTK